MSRRTQAKKAKSVTGKRAIDDDLQKQLEKFNLNLSKTSRVAVHHSKTTTIPSMYEEEQFINLIEALHEAIKRKEREEIKEIGLKLLNEYIMPAGFEPTENSSLRYPGIIFRQGNSRPIPTRRQKFPNLLVSPDSTHEIKTDVRLMTAFGDFACWKVLATCLPIYFPDIDHEKVINALKATCYNYIIVEEDPYMLCIDSNYAQNSLFNDDLVVPYLVHGLEYFFVGDKLEKASGYSGKHMVDGKVLPFPKDVIQPKTSSIVVTVNTNVKPKYFRKHFAKELGIEENEVKEKEILDDIISESAKQFLPTMLTHFSDSGRSNNNVTIGAQDILTWDVERYTSLELSGKTQSLHVHFKITFTYLPLHGGYYKISWVKKPGSNTIGSNILDRLPSSIIGERKQSNGEVVIGEKKPYVNFTPTPSSEMKQYAGKACVTLEGEPREGMFDPIYLMAMMEKDQSPCGVETGVMEATPEISQEE